MSVVSHLYHGELRDWCEARLTGSAEVARDAAASVRDHEIVRPAGPVERYYWSQAGRAFTLRLATLVQPAPPYSALLGLARAGLVSRAWADAQAARYPTHARLPEHLRERALDMWPMPGGWADLKSARDAGGTVGTAFTSTEQDHRRFSRPGRPDEPVLSELFDRMRGYFAAHATLGRLGEPGPERGLARLCWILAAFQYAYRNDSIEHPLFRVFRDDVPSVEELHRGVTDELIADPLSLTRLLSTSGALRQMRALAGDPPAGTPWGVNCPVIFDHWDDSSFLLNGPDGATLLEAVSLIKADDTHSRGRRRIWKLLASAWLDTADTFRIRTVAVYYARHGVLVTWPVESLAALLTEGNDPQRARNEFVGLATRLRDADRARRAAWRAGRDRPPAEGSSGQEPSA